MTLRVYLRLAVIFEIVTLTASNYLFNQSSLICHPKLGEGDSLCNGPFSAHFRPLWHWSGSYTVDHYLHTAFFSL